MLTYKIQLIRKKRSFAEVVIFTDYGQVTANILLNERTLSWTPGVDRFEKGFFETRQYGPAKVLVFRMPYVENPEAAAASRNSVWSDFLESSKNGFFNRSVYMDLCENGFPAQITLSDIDKVFRSLGMNRESFDCEREKCSLDAMNNVFASAETNGYVSEKTRKSLAETLKENGCYLKYADRLKHFYRILEKEWVHVSMPVFPNQKYLFWNDGIYEIRSFYKRPHGQTCASDKKYEEDLSWSVSLGLKKFDWTGAEVCWRVSCKNIVDSEKGKELLLRAFSIKDDRASYFNACSALKDVKEELLKSEYGKVFEFYGTDADKYFDLLLQENIILNCVRKIVIENKDGSIVFADYEPNRILSCKTVRKEDVNDNVKILISALNIHKRTIEITRERLFKSEIYLAVKKKGFCS